MADREPSEVEGEWTPLRLTAVVLLALFVFVALLVPLAPPFQLVAIVLALSWVFLEFRGKRRDG